MNTEQRICKIENRFKQVADIHTDIAIYPLTQDTHTQVKTDDKKSKSHGEVFTPLWLVDEMLDKVLFIPDYMKTLDLCAGFGQFSIRLMRRHLYLNPKFDLDMFFQNHSLAELQLSSCYKLISIFGKNINLFMGDALQLPKLPDNPKGIWLYVEAAETWVSVSKTIGNIFQLSDENKFVQVVEALTKYYGFLFEKAKEKMSSIVSGKTTVSEYDHWVGQLRNIKEFCQNEAAQKHGTPSEIIDLMVENVDDLESKKIAVLYNADIVAHLIEKKGVARKNVVFGTGKGTELEVEKLRSRYEVEIRAIEDKKVYEGMGGRKFDLVLSNPPYNRNLDLKILRSLLGDGKTQALANEYVIVHPSTWLLDQKNKSSLYEDLKSALDGKVRSVKLFNGNIVFGVELFVPCMITYIDAARNCSKINVELFDDKFQADCLGDITKFGSSWKTKIEPFFQAIKKAVQRNGHIWSHNVREIVPNKKYCQLAAIIGHHGKSETVMTRDDFFTMTIRNSNANIGVREPRLHKPGGKTPTFAFETDVEVKNFLSYLNTDFARFCLSFYKIGQHLENGELEIIPWLDFTQSWDDEKLFKKFEVNKETQDYIRKFLPDYYGIRKQG